MYLARHNSSPRGDRNNSDKSGFLNSTRHNSSPRGTETIPVWEEESDVSQLILTGTETGIGKLPKIYMIT